MRPTRSTKLGSQKSKKTETLEHEKAVASQLGGYAQPASGSMPAHKGDVKLDDFLLDLKDTEHGTIRIDGKDLTKITREAIGEGKNPALVITIKKLPPVTENEWVMVPLSVFDSLLKEVEDER